MSEIYEQYNSKQERILKSEKNLDKIVEMEAPHAGKFDSAILLDLPEISMDIRFTARRYLTNKSFC